MTEQAAQNACGSNPRQGDLCPGDTPTPDADGHRLAHLDGWRGISILIVLVGHFLHRWINEGISEIGVDLFFVLSGRLMCQILFERKIDLRQFFIRRFSRVYPGLLCFVLLAAILFSQSHIKVGPLAILSAQTFTLNYAMIYFHHTGIFDHLWSLCVEEHAYILLALLALIVRRTGTTATWIIIAAGSMAIVNGLIQRLLLDHGQFQVFWRTDVMIAPILLAGGFFLAFRDVPDRVKTWLAPSVLILAFAIRFLCTNPIATFGLWTLLTALAVAILESSPRVLQRALSFAPLRQVGIWSFSIYLWQQPFYKLMGAAPLWLLGLAALGAGLLSFYCIETPARSLINKKAATQRIGAPA
jgi:peptidoglycan/LPS O-acetylase OafA/YrhL